MLGTCRKCYEEPDKSGVGAAVIQLFKHDGPQVNSPTEITPLHHLPETQRSEEGEEASVEMFGALFLSDSLLSQGDLTALTKNRLLLLFNFRSEVTPNGLGENYKL
ncbi:Hypothetical predicted protein [Xyrichtys novacula]|uniref:Uncharacterized protein n=1 Tax=Xyrichtys novacula TaxID=13765 RepID=A0AAV1GN49_XYRNO|nr:Hypothetical predicted protein [Xyrichtys novacula]